MVDINGRPCSGCARFEAVVGKPPATIADGQDSDSAARAAARSRCTSSRSGSPWTGSCNGCRGAGHLRAADWHHAHGDATPTPKGRLLAVATTPARKESRFRSGHARPTEVVSRGRSWPPGQRAHGRLVALRRKAMMSARSRGSLASCTTILLPGTSALGFSSQRSSRFALQMIPEWVSAGEYSNPG